MAGLQNGFFANADTGMAIAAWGPGANGATNENQAVLQGACVMSQAQSGKFTDSSSGEAFKSDRRRRETNLGHRRVSDVEAFRSEPAEASDSEQNVGDGERLLSAAAGIGLGLVGFARKGLRGLPLIAAGAALVWRGYTGRCQCYTALEIDTAKRSANGGAGWPRMQIGEIDYRRPTSERPLSVLETLREFAASDAPFEERRVNRYAAVALDSGGCIR